VKVIWKDAIEGTPEPGLGSQRRTQLREATTAIVTTLGLYLKVANGYLILSEVLQEESNGRLIYEKQAVGKWLAIPLGVISQVSHAGEIMRTFSQKTKRRRTILNQLRFLPRTKRLANGELSRTLYLT
jgi:hypothetical protein